jgi:sirohydrochlorin cobaltochelatase
VIKKPACVIIGDDVKTAIVILGHGSRSEGADDSIRQAVARIRNIGSYEMVVHAFLQYASPSLSDVLEDCIRQQVAKVIVVPFLLQFGAHVSTDIPELVKAVKMIYPRLEIVVTDYVGGHRFIVDIIADLIKNTE